MALIKFILAIFAIGWIASLFPGVGSSTDGTPPAPGPSTKKADPTVDFSRALETAGNTLVCPIDIVFDNREGHGVAAALDVATAVFHREEKAARLGCEDWRGGVAIELSDKERVRGREIQSQGKCGFLESEGRLIFSCAIRNAPEIAPKETPIVQQLSPPSEAGKVWPSFDCNKARTYAETTICANDDLAEQDKNIVAEYRRILDSLSREQAEDFKQDQAAWRSQVRDNCSSIECIRKAQSVRIVELSSRQ